ncbi:Protein of unknown function [Duganella sp. CF517]|uniref:DUF2975 domain-containing protein n=1 Tax=Duganella sp. CF517 TaxID=1881038 RepID=UPI0008AC6164|nr:DUF2975 domain-containing protein [Duganella sp. CF517]SEO52130.1 Protein of unknown function [Duganella sp. CF517]
MNTSVIRSLLWGFLCIQTIFFFLAWTTIEPAVGPMVVKMSATGVAPAAKLAMTPGQRTLCAAIALPALLALGYGLWRLDRLLLNFRRQHLFTSESIGHLRMFAGATLLSTILSIIEPPTRTLALWAGRKGDLEFTVGVNSEQLMLMLVCALFYLITRLMQEGRRLAEENESFI